MICQWCGETISLLDRHLATAVVDSIMGGKYDPFYYHGDCWVHVFTVARAHRDRATVVNVLCNYPNFPALISHCGKPAVHLENGQGRCADHATKIEPV